MGLSARKVNLPTRNIDAALEYAARGWHVFPVWNARPDGTCGCGHAHDGSTPPGAKRPLAPKDVGKHPIVAGGHHKATINPDMIRHWWERHPDASIAVAVAPSGLAVLDVDIADGRQGEASLVALNAAHPLPDTLAARTGSGGLHAIFNLPAGAPAARKIAIRPGLDLIADGYFIAPPSTHRSGKRYAWLRDAPIVDLPVALVAELGTARAKESVPYAGGQPADQSVLDAAWNDLLEHGPSVKGQGGDAHAFQVGSILLNDWDLTWDDAWALACRWNDHFPENAWSENRLAEKLRNGCAYASGHRGKARSDLRFANALESAIGGAGDRPFAGPAWAADVERAAQSVPQPNPSHIHQSAHIHRGGEYEDDGADITADNKDDAPDFMAMVMEAARDLKAYRAGSINSPDKPVPIFSSARDLFARSFPATSWLVRGILADESVAVVAGEPKSTKSWAAIEIAMACATNTPAFGEFQTGPEIPVAMFLAEDSERGVRNRLRALAAGRGLSVNQAVSRIAVSCRQPLDLADDAQLSRLIASCRVLPELPKLVILDPMRDLHHGDEDSSKEMGDFMGRLRAIRDIIGASVLFVHHSQKSSKDSAKRRSGQKMRGSGAIHGAVDSGFYIRNVETIDGKCNWTTDIEVEIKAAQGAGLFKLDLHVADDSHGEAVLAEWNVRSIGDDDPDAVAGDKDVQVVVDYLVKQPEGQATFTKISAEVGGRAGRTTIALEKLKESGQVSPVTRGARQIGWQLEPAIIRQKQAEGSIK